MPAGAGGRSTPLRVDAQRNLEHVLRAAREVFGELGYGAPMEDVARRARVGVGTVYRRFPSKDVLVRRIAEEETATADRAGAYGAGPGGRPVVGTVPLPADVGRLGCRAAAAAGHTAGSADADRLAETADGGEGPRVPDGLSDARVPQQRRRPARTGYRSISGWSPRRAPRRAGPLRRARRPRRQRPPAAASVSASVSAEETAGADALLEVVGRLVERARTAGELRADVTVSDILLVIATGAPTLPDPGHQQAASARLLEILLEGLRSRPAR